MILTAIATTWPPTGKGVKLGLERIKTMPAAAGASASSFAMAGWARNSWSRAWDDQWAGSSPHIRFTASCDDAVN